MIKTKLMKDKCRKKKGYNLIGEDFLKFEGKWFDRIIMNPLRALQISVCKVDSRHSQKFCPAWYGITERRLLELREFPADQAAGIRKEKYEYQSNSKGLP